jgi:F-type H+-transporting ATPase subunit epsilon
MAQETKTTGTLKLHVRSPLGSAVEAEVRSVMLPGIEGDFTVLTDHHHTVAQLRHGIATFDARDQKQHLSIFGGVATVHTDEVEVFSPVCERAEDLDEQRAEAARQRAEERLADRQEGIDIARAQAALGRALLRLEVVELLRRT